MSPVGHTTTHRDRGGYYGAVDAAAAKAAAAAAAAALSSPQRTGAPATTSPHHQQQLAWPVVTRQYNVGNSPINKSSTLLTRTQRSRVGARRLQPFHAKVLQEVGPKLLCFNSNLGGVGGGCNDSDVSSLTDVDREIMRLEVARARALRLAEENAAKISRLHGGKQQQHDRDHHAGKQKSSPHRGSPSPGCAVFGTGGGYEGKTSHGGGGSNTNSSDNSIIRVGGGSGSGGRNKPNNKNKLGKSKRHDIFTEGAVRHHPNNSNRFPGENPKVMELDSGLKFSAPSPVKLRRYAVQQDHPQQWVQPKHNDPGITQKKKRETTTTRTECARRSRVGGCEKEAENENAAEEGERGDQKRAVVVIVDKLPVPRPWSPSRRRPKERCEGEGGGGEEREVATDMQAMFSTTNSAAVPDTMAPSSEPGQVESCPVDASAAAATAAVAPQETPLYLQSAPPSAAPSDPESPPIPNDNADDSIAIQRALQGSYNNCSITQPPQQQLIPRHPEPPAVPSNLSATHTTVTTRKSEKKVPFEKVRGILDRIDDHKRKCEYNRSVMACAGIPRSYASGATSTSYASAPTQPYRSPPSHHHRRQQPQQPTPSGGRAATSYTAAAAAVPSFDNSAVRFQNAPRVPKQEPNRKAPSPEYYDQLMDGSVIGNIEIVRSAYKDCRDDDPPARDVDKSTPSVDFSTGRRLRVDPSPTGDTGSYVRHHVVSFAIETTNSIATNDVIPSAPSCRSPSVGCRRETRGGTGPKDPSAVAHAVLGWESPPQSPPRARQSWFPIPFPLEAPPILTVSTPPQLSPTDTSEQPPAKVDAPEHDEEDDNNIVDGGDNATKKKPDPPPFEESARSGDGNEHSANADVVVATEAPAVVDQQWNILKNLRHAVKSYNKRP